MRKSHFLKNVTDQLLPKHASICCLGFLISCFIFIVKVDATYCFHFSVILIASLLSKMSGPAYSEVIGGFRVTLPPPHLSTNRCGGLTKTCLFNP